MYRMYLLLHTTTAYCYYVLLLHTSVSRHRVRMLFQVGRAPDDSIWMTQAWLTRHGMADVYK